MCIASRRIVKLKMRQIAFVAGVLPGPYWGAHSAPQTP